MNKTTETQKPTVTRPECAHTVTMFLPYMNVGTCQTCGKRISLRALKLKRTK